MAQIVEQAASNKPPPANTHAGPPSGLAGIRSGVVLRGCECNKRNGLTYDCRCGLKKSGNPNTQGQSNHPCPPSDGMNVSGGQVYCQQPIASTNQNAQGDGTVQQQMQGIPLQNQTQGVPLQNQTNMGNNPQYGRDPANYQGQGSYGAPNQQYPPVACDQALAVIRQMQGGYGQPNIPISNQDPNAYNNPHIHNQHPNTAAIMPDSPHIINQTNPHGNETVPPVLHPMAQGNVCPHNMIQHNQMANPQMQQTCAVHQNPMLCAQNEQNSQSEHVHNAAMQHATHNFGQSNYNSPNVMNQGNVEQAANMYQLAQNTNTFPTCPHQQNPHQNATFIENQHLAHTQGYQQHAPIPTQANTTNPNSQINSTNQQQNYQMHMGSNNQSSPYGHQHPHSTMPATAPGTNTQQVNYSHNPNTMPQFQGNQQYYEPQHGTQQNIGYWNTQQTPVSQNYPQSVNQQQSMNNAALQNHPGVQYQQANSAGMNTMQQGQFGMMHSGHSNAVAPTA